MGRQSKVSWYASLFIVCLLAPSALAEEAIVAERLQGLLYSTSGPAEYRVARPAPEGMDLTVAGCLRHASRLHAARVGPGVDFEQLDAPVAAQACQAALKVAPDDPDIENVLARVQLAAGNYQQAEALLNKVAATGNTFALYGLAKLNLEPKFQGGSSAKYIEFLEKAVSLGDATATTDLAQSYARGFGVTKDIFKAEILFKDAANLGDARATHHLIILYLREPALTLNDNSFETLAGYARHGNLQAQIGIALHYLTAISKPRDDAKAFHLVEGAAKLGNTDALILLGSMYAVGRGVERNEQEALAQYRAAADLGDPMGSYAAGLLYLKGLGNGPTRVDQDQGIAHTYFIKAAELGHVRAFSALGWQYAEGKGVERDLQQSWYWYRKSIKANDPEGLNGAGVLLGNSTNAEQQAYGMQLLKRATVLGSLRAAENLKLFCAKRRTPACD